MIRESVNGTQFMLGPISNDESTSGDMKKLMVEQVKFSPMSGKMKEKSKRLKGRFRFTILQVFLVTLFENSPLWTLQKYFQKVHSPDSFAEVRFLSLLTLFVVTHCSPKVIFSCYALFLSTIPTSNPCKNFFVYIEQKYVI